MHTSRTARWDSARALVDLAQAGLDRDRYAAETLRVLDRAIGFDAGLCIGAEQDGFESVLGLEDERRRHLERGKREIDGRYAYELRTAWQAVKVRGACVDREIFTADERRELPLFREVIRPAGMRSLLLLCARWQGRPISWIYLSRHGGHPFRSTQLDEALHLLPTIEASFVAQQACQPVAHLERLTAREREVAAHVARGLTTPQVALVLGTSPHTVRNQIGRIFDKLGVASRAELAAALARAAPAFERPEPGSR